jgi:hypothetical protein
MGTKSYVIEKYQNASNRTHLRLFDSKGECILLHDYDENNVLKVIHRWKYDDKGREVVAYYESKKEDEKYHYEYRYEYDDNNRLIKFEEYNDDKLNEETSYTVTINMDNDDTHGNSYTAQKHYYNGNDSAPYPMGYPCSVIEDNIEYKVINNKQVIVAEKNSEYELTNEYNDNGDLITSIYNYIGDNDTTTVNFNPEDKSIKTITKDMYGNTIIEREEWRNNKGLIIEEDEINHEDDYRAHIFYNYDSKDRIINEKYIEDGESVNLTLTDYNSLGNISSIYVYDYKLKDEEDGTVDKNKAIKKHSSYFNKYYKNTLITLTSNLEGEVSYRLLGVEFVDIDDEDLDDFIKNIDKNIIL